MNSKTLNPSQQKAVNHTGGPLLIIAGAGTGKTTVITERIKKLIFDKKVSPQNILALTFTEKAAREMLDRLDVVMPLGYEEPWIMTFHSFCDRILRQEGLEIGLPTDYQILDTPNQWILVRHHLFEFGLKYYLPLGNPTRFIAALLKFFSRCQDEDVLPQDFKKNIDKDERLEELAQAYKKYQEIKLKENFLDFGDLVLWTLILFRKRPNILAKYRKQFKHILVDEFQDTNWAQLQLIKLLAPLKDNPNLAVVGDDDQSVYKWRGAAVSNILDFKKHYPKSQEVVLTENYRSGQKLLDTSYKLIINNNPDRLEVKLGVEKKLKANRGSDLAFPQICQLKTLEEEADFVVARILELIGKEKYTFRDFAILARANNHLDPFVAALKRSGIPYQLLGNRGLYNQDEVRDLIFFAKTCIDPTDSVVIFQTMHIPIFKITADKMLEALAKSRLVKKPLWEIIKDDADFGLLVSEVNKTREKITKLPASKILLDFVNKTGYLKLFLPESLENQLKVKNLSLFFEKIKRFEADNKNSKLVEFINWLDLLMEAGENPAQAQIEDVDTVVLSTVHGVKGLEFPAVFVVNCVSDRFPTRSRSDPIEFPENLIKETLPTGDSHLQEERRLFYVACTRARDYLFLTMGLNYGGVREKKPSVFLKELSLSIEKINFENKQFAIGIIPKPRKVIGGKLKLDYISYSQIDTYLTCPLKYKYRYILQIPTKPHHALTYGTTVHATLRDFHFLQLKGKNPDLKTLLEMFTTRFDETGYDSQAHKKERFKQGKETLKKYFTNHKESFKGKPVFLEKKFYLKLGSIPLFGRIDRIDKVNGKYELIDYKTGKSKTQKDADKDKQLTIYAMAAQWSLGIKPENLSLYFIDDNLKFSTQRNEEMLLKEKENIRKTIGEIQKSDFPAKPGFPVPCQYCDYNPICPFAKKS